MTKKHRQAAFKKAIKLLERARMEVQFDEYAYGQIFLAQLDVKARFYMYYDLSVRKRKRTRTVSGTSRVAVLLYEAMKEKKTTRIGYHGALRRCTWVTSIPPYSLRQR
jgi:hypothetical protein